MDYWCHMCNNCHGAHNNALASCGMHSGNMGFVRSILMCLIVIALIIRRRWYRVLFTWFVAHTHLYLLVHKFVFQYSIYIQYISIYIHKFSFALVVGFTYSKKAEIKHLFDGFALFNRRKIVCLQHQNEKGDVFLLLM